MASTDDLWGGTLVGLAFDLAPWALRCVVEAERRGSLDRYDLVFNDVASFELAREVRPPWSYVEFTKIWVEGGPSNYQAEVVPWSEPSGFEVRCSSVGQGATIGPAIVFGYLAAEDNARSVVPAAVERESA
jgi:hypothetical protein